MFVGSFNICKLLSTIGLHDSCYQLIRLYDSSIVGYLLYSAVATAVYTCHINSKISLNFVKSTHLCQIYISNIIQKQKFVTSIQLLIKSMFSVSVYNCSIIMSFFSLQQYKIRTTLTVITAALSTPSAFICPICLVYRSLLKSL